MKKVKIATKNKLSVGSKVVTGQQIALSLLVASSFVLGLNFIIMAFSKPRAVTNIEEIAVKPLMVNNITSASVNMLVWDPWGDFIGVTSTTPMVHFLTNSNSVYNELGNLELSYNNYNFISSSNASFPLAVRLSSDQYQSPIPARILTIQQSNREYKLCLPATDRFSNSPNFYYDFNGTPYYDSSFREMATTKPCPELLLPTCTDTEPNEDPFVKGATFGVTINGEEYLSEDTCYGVNDQGVGTQIGKFYCFNNPGGPGLVSGQRVINCDNGCSAETDTCIVSPQIDLTISDITTTPSSPTVNSTTTITTHVRNNGNTPLYNVLNFSHGYNFGDFYKFSAWPVITPTISTSTPLYPGQEYFVSYTGRFESAGEKELSMTIDSGNVVPESDETNNTFIKNVFVNDGILQPPVITSPLAVTVKPVQQFSYTITATNNPTSFFANNLPPRFLSFNSTTGVISGNPLPGVYNIEIGATNSAGTDTEILVLEVEDLDLVNERLDL